MYLLPKHIAFKMVTKNVIMSCKRHLSTFTNLNIRLGQQKKIEKLPHFGLENS